MKKWITLFIISIIPIGLFAQENPTVPTTKIANFYQDKTAAITYTFDDGLKDQADLAVPMLEELGFRGTFFIITSIVAETEEEAAKRYAAKPGEKGTISWPRLKELSLRGHEVSNHSWSHKQMIKLDDATLEDEICKAQKLIEEKIGKKPLTFCYPGNGKNDHVKELVMKSHIASRDFQRGFGKPDFTAEIANKWADDTIKKKEWGVVMIHGITAGYDAFSSAQVLQDHLKYVKQKEDQVWVDTFLNVSLYNKEKESAKVAVVEAKDKELKLKVESDLDSSIYNFPLTLVVDVKGAGKAEALRSQQKLPVRVMSDKIQVDIVPGAEPVVLTWQ